MDIYSRMLEVVKTEKDLEIFLANETDPEYLYQLSASRENIVEWIDISPDAVVLEIGAGCGAISGVLSRKARKVVAYEPDKRKCAVNKARHEDMDNLMIVSDATRLDSVGQVFDYVTLVDTFSPENLEIALKYLKKGGRIIFAVGGQIKEQFLGQLDAKGVVPKEEYVAVPDHIIAMEIFAEKSFKTEAATGFASNLGINRKTYSYLIIGGRAGE